MRSLTGLSCGLPAALLLGLCLFPSRHAAAANITVNSLADTPDALLNDGLCADANGACTLRAAIQQANADAAADVIGFSVNGTINLTGALPDLSTNVSVNGPGASLLTVRRDTGGEYRIFLINEGVTASISGLTISNGRALPDLVDNGGGGLLNDGTLTMTGCIVGGNSTGDAPAPTAPGAVAGGGGGIRNNGTMTMTSCTVSNNKTGKNTGGFNRAAGGGGVANTGTMTMTGCTVSNNLTSDGGDGTQDNGNGGNGGGGGGILNFPVNRRAILTLINCTVSGNRTGKGGVSQGASGNSSGPGGDGGGIYNNWGMNIVDSTISGNVTGDGANARSGIPGPAGQGGSGGGIYNSVIGGSLDVMTVTNSTISGNTTGRGGAGGGASISNGDGGDGGGISNASDVSTLKVSNSSVVGNTAGLSGDGGGRDGHGGGINGGGLLRSTIVAQSITRLGSGRDVFGSFVSSGYNLIGISNGGCCFTTTDQVGFANSPVFPLLGPLADNGGPTLTHALLPGSPAIDKGLARDIDDQPVTTDQRGFARPFDDPTITPQTGGDNSDIGAFERQSTDPTPTPTPTPTTVQFSAATSSVTEGCVQTEVTITRAGPKDGTTVATYAVTDFEAHQRGDFTYATARVTFAPGEDTKTVPVLISEDAYAEGTENLIVFLVAVEGGQLGAPNPIKVQIPDNDATDGATNPIDDNATFVCQHYHDFLNRQADPSGQDFWTNQLAACNGDAGCLDRKRVDVSAAFFLSIEFQHTGYFAIRVNKAAFGDRPGNPQYLPFLAETQEIGRGVIVRQPGYQSLLEANMQRYAEEFVVRPDFEAAHGGQGQDAGHYVDSLFVNTGATPTQAERDAAISAFGTGDIAGRARALRSVVESGSVYNKLYNPAFVLMQYFAYLRRDPNSAPDTNYDGYNFWLAKLNSVTQPGEDARDERVALARVRRAEMIRAFLLSTEYRGRFQGDPNRGS